MTFLTTKVIKTSIRYKEFPQRLLEGKLTESSDIKVIYIIPDIESHLDSLQKSRMSTI